MGVVMGEDKQYLHGGSRQITRKPAYCCIYKCFREAGRVMIGSG